MELGKGGSNVFYSPSSDNPVKARLHGGVADKSPAPKPETTRALVGSFLGGNPESTDRQTSARAVAMRNERAQSIDVAKGLSAISISLGL